MRTLSAEGSAACASGVVPMALLIEMGFSPTLNMCTAGTTLQLGGVEYMSIAGPGKIGSVQENPAEIKSMSFELSGVPSSSVSLVMGTPVQGKPVSIKLAIFSPATYQVLDTSLLWSGALDTMGIVDGADSATVNVSAEHVGIDLNRARPTYYTDSEQQDLHAGDLFFQYTSQQFDQQVVWPAAAYFKK